MAPRKNDDAPEDEAFQPVRRLRTRSVQGRSGGSGAAPEDGKGEGGGGETRVAALRRFAAAARRHRALHLAGCAALLAVALTAGSIALGAARDNTGQHVAPASAAISPGLLTTGDLDTGIASLQSHLRDQPRDFGSWSTLGLAYVEQARTKGDPSRYPQAEQAFKRSLALSPDNDQALAGRAALAAARHDFEDALKYADQALKVNPYSERALCTRVDALVELGRYADAAKAADTADDRRPGIPVFTRYAYVRELRGDVRTAERVLRQALSSAISPATSRTSRRSSANSPGTRATTTPRSRTTPEPSPPTRTTSPPWRAAPAPRPRAATGPARSRASRTSSPATPSPARWWNSASCTSRPATR